MKIEQDKPLAPFTTIGLGGPAKWYVECSSELDVTDALSWARKHQHAVYILGGGSNSLISDRGFEGVVIHLATKGITWQDKGNVTVAAGEPWDHFVQQTVDLGLAGVECLAGIPGLVGAAPIQNVGAYGQEVKDTIDCVRVMNRLDGSVHVFSNDACRFSYRNSRFKDASLDKDKFVILDVTFNLNGDAITPPTYPELLNAVTSDPLWPKVQNSQTDTLKIIYQKVLKIRSKKGMVVSKDDPDSKSLGSFFMNPILSAKQKKRLETLFSELGLTQRPTFYDTGDGRFKVSAAWLIEHAGITRGQSLRGAGVSTKHTLALVNRGQATTADILELGKFIENQVFKRFEIQLEMEPQIT